MNTSSRALAVMVATVSLCLVVFASSAFAAKAPLANVPVVGCPSDGQVGPVAAPEFPSMRVALAPSVAKRLAFYRGPYDEGVLGPRGWSCVELEGSNGAILLVTPNPLNANEVWKARHAVEGPAIQLTERSGETSGRIEVAAMIARIFPVHLAIAQAVERSLPQLPSFATGPFPADRLTYRSDRRVEYETPANANGLGTMSRLSPSPLPIRGVAMLLAGPPDAPGVTPDMKLLAVRLPPALADLTPRIIHELETRPAPPPQ